MAREEIVILLHNHDLDVEEGHGVRAEGFSSFSDHTPRTPSRSASSLRLVIISFASRILSRLRISRDDLLTDTVPTMWVISRYFASLALTFVLFLLPRYMRKGGLKPTKKAHITSYLDSLRGWAAVIVVNYHHFPYQKTWFMKLPFATLLVQGRSMVDVFFVISGYVLSYRMLKLMRTQQTVPLFDTFISSVFRRYLRLYGSAAVASFVSMLLVMFKWTRRRGLVGQGTVVSQVWAWFVDFLQFSNVFANVEGYWHKRVLTSKFLDPLWTIPVEFRGSMVLFAFCIGVCKLSTRNRMILCCVLMLLAYYWIAIYIALFLGGLFLADLSFTWHPERLDPLLAVTTDNSKSTLRYQHLSERIFYSVMLVLALFLLSQPLEKPQESAWPWPVLEGLIPTYYLFSASEAQDHWWLGIGAFLLVWALDSYPTLQAPLLWNFSRYLGHLSFGIYVMHMPVIWTVWKHILDPFRLSLFGGSMLGYAPFLVLNMGAVFWAADLFIRVDQRVVTLGKWIQEKLFTW